MPRPVLTYDSAAELLYKHVMAQLNSTDRKQLENWAACSKYNRKLIDDLNDDAELRKRVIESYYSDHTEFWKIVVLYRAALHNGSKRKSGSTEW